ETAYSPWQGAWTTIGGTPFASQTLVAADDAATFHVPTDGEDPLAWTAPAYDDADWLDEIAEGQAGLLVTEVSTGLARYVEIQNVSDDVIDTTDWAVLVNDPSLGSPDDVLATAWHLPPSVAAGQVLYQTDDPGEAYWGATIPWDPEGPGWAMILDSGGTVMDFVAWGYTVGDIASLSIDYGGFTDITVGEGWGGAGADIGTAGSGPPAVQFTAFNDHVAGTGTHANATSYAANGTVSGPLKDVATGDDTPVTLATSASGIHYGDNGAAPAAGTDAYTVFDGYVDFRTATESSIEIAALDGDYYTHTFTGLDTGPDVTYNFTGTAIRGDTGYTDRWTLVTLDDADGATAAHSSGLGVVVVSPNQVAIWTGYNSAADQGFVAAWTDIDPGADGDFSVISTQYTGPTPGVGSGTADGTKGYGLAGIRLENVAPSGPLSFLKRTGNRDSDGAADFVRSPTASKGDRNAGMTVPFGTITPVAMGLGFSTGPYDAYVGTDVADAMMDTSASLWTRIEFQAPDLSTYDALKLSIRYDDGFAAYLNGIKVTERNAPAGLAWDSAATGEHAGDTFEDIDLADYLGDLNVGDNVLAIHGLNYGASDTDFLIQAELAATRGTPGAGLTLSPGINRLTVQALDETGAEVERTTLDVWYDTGSMTGVSGTLPAGTTTWAAAGGPYHVTANVTVPSGATLVIEPGATVFFDAGTQMTVAGRLDARGTALNHVRLTSTPGAAEWTGLRFSGSPAGASELAYVDIEYSGNGSESIEATGGAKVHLDHIVWDHHNAMFLDWHDSSIQLTNSVLPTISTAEAVHFWGFPADGYALFDGNWFGGASGYNDVIDLTGGQRPGPIARFTNNVFAGGGDDCLDLDAADAYVAGNLFMNVHQDADRASKSYCVAIGTEYGDLSRVTVAGNTFYDVDHALLSKDGGFITAVNNTIVNVNKTYSGATTAVVSFFEDRSGQWPGVGVILEGNIIVGAENLWENLDGLSTTTVVTANRNIIYDVDFGTFPVGGVGNLVENPRLWNTTNVTDPWTDFVLRPGSPAIGTGPNGADMGALAGYLATVAGEPNTTTWQDTATLTVGGPDIYGYKYRVMKDGAWLGDWSAEATLDWTVPNHAVTSLVRNGSTATATVPGHGFSEGDVIVIEGAGSREYKGPFTISNVTANTFDYTVTGSPTSPASGTIVCWKPQAAPAVPPIELTALAPGQYTVFVVTRNSAGFWQGEADATASRTWTVDPAFAQLRINEVLADNETALPVGGLYYPDAVELYYDAAPGSPALSLTGYGLTDNDLIPGKFTFGPGASIAAGQHLVLYADTDPGGVGGTWLGFGIKAEGDDVWLYAPGGVTVVDSVAFGIQLADRAIGRAGPDAAWTLTDPTFGAANQATRTGDAQTLCINEWLADGEVLFVNDFVELYNADPLPVRLGGLYLSDSPGPVPDLYQVPALSFAEGGAMAVFTADNDPGQGADHVNFAVSPFQGLLGLFDADLGPIDQVYYTPQTADVSYGRTPDGADAYAFFRLPTPGVANPADPTGVTTEVNLLGYTDTWHYEESGFDLGTIWYGTGYDPASPGDGSLWKTGAAVLYIESDALPNEPGTGSPLPKNTLLADRGDGRPYNTYYFRISFDLGATDPDDVVALNLNTLVDDGAVLYLNGQELRRIAMRDPWPTAINFGSMASRSGEVVFESFVIDTDTLSPGQLVAGENLLAVEVHQGSANSSDVVWAMNLTATVHTTSEEDPLEPLYNLLDDLRITEIMYDPQGGKDYEFIELQNTGTGDLDLTGMRLRGGVDFTFPAMTLPAGQYVVVVADLADFEYRYGSAVNVAGQWDGALDNDGEEVILRLPDPYDAAVLRFDYDNDWYAPLTDGDGLSLNILDPLAHRRTWDERGSWRPSGVLHGSPGAADPAPEYPVGALVINEVLAHQDQPTGDWIEIYNNYSQPIDLAGWFLSDDSAALTQYEITETAPGDKVLQPGQYMVFTETDDFGAAFALSEHGDDVWLSSPSGDYVESAVFGASDNAVTLGRYTTSTGAVHFVALSAPTAGYLNAYPKVGPVVISEIMYHPVDGQDEFVELYNISGADVPLYDPAYPDRTWRFTEGFDLAFPMGVMLPAGGYLLVTQSGPAAFRTKFGIDPSVPIYGPFENLTALENDGETIELSKPGGTEWVEVEPGVWQEVVRYIQVDSVDYSDGSAVGDPWPTDPDGNGPSLERVTLGEYGDDPVNWTASPAADGSPGQDNSTAPARVTGVALNPH
ncbi:MAG TPA: lamin tail domain-containing protein, partial [Phycisphaerae bacterium]|nr:lamin tail domain-containing protein [Phycisphaerae bacterium]